MPQENGQVRQKEHLRFKEPRKFNVIIHNDDFTPMELVVEILMTVFFKSLEDATALMLDIHHSDRRIVGAYPLDIAASRTQKATKMAREAGYPLRITIEPEEEEIPF